MDTIILLFVIVSVISSLMKKAQKKQQEAARKAAVPKAMPSAAKSRTKETASGVQAPLSSPPPAQALPLSVAPFRRDPPSLEEPFGYEEPKASGLLRQNAADQSPAALSSGPALLPPAFSRDTLLQGIVMGEILARPGNRNRPGMGIPAFRKRS